jgi:hypothetical protein
LLFCSRYGGFISLFISYIAVASALGEIPLELWLMVMGVNAQRRKVQASAAADEQDSRSYQNRAQDDIF